MCTKVVEDCFVSPPPASVPTTTIPLTFFDIFWLVFPPVQRLFFYELNFTQTTLSTLKTSLSLTLQHFFPLAGKLISPPPPQLPYISYTDGDSVHLRVSESRLNFKQHIQKKEWKVEELQELVMKLESEASMAIQVTIFPDSGVSIGVSYNHAVADGRAISHFMKSWAEINRKHGDPDFEFGSIPIHNRGLIPDPDDIASIFLNHSMGLKMPVNVTPQKLLITAVVRRSEIESLKNWVKVKSMEENHANPLRISTFIVTCAYIWVCLAKFKEEKIGGDKLCHLVFTADCRGHLKLPGEYFGDCLEPRFAAVKGSELIGGNGVFAAVKAIGREVSEFEKEALRGVEQWRSKSKDIVVSGDFYLTLAGSPKLGVYETDFGWGRLKKVEVAHIGSGAAVSLAENWDEGGGIEIGVALDLDEVEKFKFMFQEGLLKHC